MKKVLASLLAIYVATNGQTPPTAPATTAAGTTAAGTTAAVIAAAPVAVAPNTIAATPSTTAAGTTSAGTGTGTGTVAQAASTTAAPNTIISAGTTTAAPGTGTTKPATTAGSPGNIVPPGYGGPGAGAGAGTGTGGAAVVTPQTPAPITPAPTTPAPTFNPYSPLPNALIAAGLQRQVAGSPDAGCITPQDIAYDFNGILKCNANYACAQCREIRCGDPMGIPCQDLVISDSGAVGNQNIKVLGSPELNNNIFGGNMQIGGGWGNNGAEIRCNGMSYKLQYKLSAKRQNDKYSKPQIKTR